MLRLTIKGDEFFNHENQEFVYENSVVVEMEHSLATISKWESITKKAFLGKQEKTPFEILDYFRIMCQTPDIPAEVWFKLSKDELEKIQTYIADPMTATHLPARGGAPGREVATSDLIYYWMFSLQIPETCAHWHLNKLLTVIQIFDAKNSSGKKKTAAEVQAERAERHRINEERLAQYQTTG